MAEKGLPPGFNMASEETRQAFGDIATIWKSWFVGEIDTEDIGRLEHKAQQRHELPRAALRVLSYTAFEACFTEWHKEKNVE